MASGVSVHVGYDYKHPNSGTGLGSSPYHNDARRLQKLATDRGFVSGSRHLVLGKRATPDQVLREIDDAIKRLDHDGLLLLTFACHGSAWYGGLGTRLGERLHLHDGHLTDKKLAGRLERLTSSQRAAIIADACASSGIASGLLSIYARFGGDVKRYGARPTSLLMSEPDLSFAGIMANRAYEVPMCTYGRLVDKSKRSQFAATIWELAAAKKGMITPPATCFNDQLHGQFSAQMLCTFSRASKPTSYADLKQRLRASHLGCKHQSPDSDMQTYGPDETADEIPLTPRQGD